MEGWLSTTHDPQECSIALNVSSGPQEVDMTLALADFISAGGPFLCQIDFEAEVAGLMAFHARLVKKNRALCTDTVVVRIINPQRDGQGNRRTGHGALKVKK